MSLVPTPIGLKTFQDRRNLGMVKFRSRSRLFEIALPAGSECKSFEISLQSVRLVSRALARRRKGMLKAHDDQIGRSASKVAPIRSNVRTASANVAAASSARP